MGWVQIGISRFSFPTPVKNYAVIQVSFRPSRLLRWYSRKTSRGRMISQLSSFRNNHAFATPLFFNVRLPAFATFLLSQPHDFATIFLLSQPFFLFANVKKSSFRNKVLVSQQKSPRFATSFLVSHPSPRFATTTSSFRNQFPRFATLSKLKNIENVNVKKYRKCLK